MSFASPTFLWFFLPAVLGLHWLLPERCRDGLIAATSVAFYVWGAGPFVLLLSASILCDHVAGRAFCRDRIQPARHGVVPVVAVAARLVPLAVRKNASAADLRTARTSAHASRAAGRPPVDGPLAHLTERHS